MKRWTVRILISLLLGAVTTIAVAWAFAWLNRVSSYNEVAKGVTTFEDNGWHLTVCDELGSRVIRGRPVPWLRVNAKSWWTWESEVLDAGAIGRIPDCFLYEEIDADYRTRLERGWPFRALAAEVNGVPYLPDNEATWAIRVAPVRKNDMVIRAVDERIVMLPLKPLPLGFAMDTGIYGTFWLGVFSLWSLARRRQPLLTLRMVFAVALILLVLGASTTVAIAWICAVCVDEEYINFEPGDAFGTDGYPNVRAFGRWWLFRDEEPGALRLDSSLIIGGGGGSGGSPDANAHDIYPSWSAELIAPPGEWLERNSDDSYVMGGFGGTQEMNSWGRRIADARGWPMLSMWSGLKLREEISEDGSHGVVVPDEVVNGILIAKYYEGEFRNDWSRLIPLAPIWFGFAVDTLFYAFFWSWFALFILGPKIFVRTLRKRKGRCPLCGYDLRGDFESGCSECGWNREENVATSKIETKNKGEVI